VNIFELEYIKRYLWFVYWCDHPVALSWETIQKSTIIVWDAKNPGLV